MQKNRLNSAIHDTPLKIHCWYVEYKYNNFYNFSIVKFRADNRVTANERNEVSSTYYNIEVHGE